MDVSRKLPNFPRKKGLRGNEPNTQPSALAPGPWPRRSGPTESVFVTSIQVKYRDIAKKGLWGVFLRREGDGNVPRIGRLHWGRG